MIPPFKIPQHEPYYASISSGELCFYQGLSPYFGATLNESGHRKIAWCTEPHEMNFETYQKSGMSNYIYRRLSWLDEASSPSQPQRRLGQSSSVGEMIKASFRKRSHDVIMRRIQAKCIFKVIPERQHSNTYLHVTIDGLFGLFVAPEVAAFEIASPQTRVSFLRLARCFKPFQQAASV